MKRNASPVRGGTLRNRLGSNSGIARIVVILAIAVIIMAIVAIVIPTVVSHKKVADRHGCVQALDTAQRQLIDYFLYGDIHSKEDAKELVTKVMVGWDDLCPGGGTVHIVAEDDGTYRLACGMHDTDLRERTRLNAEYVFEELKKEVLILQAKGTEYPESVEIKINGQKVRVELVDESPELRHGTRSTPGKSGTVAYYSIVGHSDYGSDSELAPGSIWFFAYADEEYCANWDSNRFWYGDSYAPVS